MTDFKYDVAFSLLAADAPVGTAINALLKNRLTTFFYPEKQEEIAGRDGLDVFSSAFSEESRVVVVLYSERWGTTKWTRVEMEAIKRRGLDHGFDFLLLIPTEKGVKMPPWYAPQRIYFDLTESSTEQAAAVIESHARRHGGEPHEESLEERAKRILEEREIASRKASFMYSPDAFAMARAQFDGVISLIEETARRMTDFGMRVDFTRFNYGGNPMAIIGGSGHSVTAVQEIFPAQPLQESEVNLTLWKGAAPYGREFAIPPQDLSNEKYRFDLAASGAPCWQSLQKLGAGALTNDRLAERVVSMLIDRIEKTSGSGR